MYKSYECNGDVHLTCKTEGCECYCHKVRETSPRQCINCRRTYSRTLKSDNLCHKCKRLNKFKHHNQIKLDIGDIPIFHLTIDEARALVREFSHDFINQHDNPVAHSAFQRISEFVRNYELAK